MRKATFYLFILFAALSASAQRADGADGYDLYRNGTLIKTLAGNATPLSFGNYGAGTYKVIAFKTDDLGNRKETVCREFTVSERDKPAVQCQDAERCGTGIVTLTAFGCDTYKWYVHNGTNYEPIDDASGATLTRNIERTTVYGVKGFLTSSGCESDILPVTATVNTLPGFTVRDGGVCADSPAYDLMLLVSGADGGTWAGPFVQGNKFLTASAEVGQTYPLTYTENTAGGCPRTETIAFTVYELPTPEMKPDDVILTMGDKVNLSSLATPSGGYFSGPGISPGGTFDASAAGEGIHEIQYTYKNPNDCTGIVKKILRVVGNYGGTIERCGPGDITIDASDILGTEYSNYKWYIWENENYVPIPSNESPQISYEVYSNCRIGVAPVIFDGSTGSVIYFDVIVNPLPAFTLKDGGVCVGSETYDLMTLVTGGNNGFWSGDFVSDNKFLTASASPGKYQLFYTETSQQGCEKSESVYFTVYDLPTPEWTSDKITIDDKTVSFDLNTYVKPSGGYFSGDYISSSGMFSPSAAGAGTHKITYTYENENGCTSSIVNDIEVIHASVRCEDTERCGPGEITLTATGGKTYLWYIYNGSTYIPLQNQTGATLTQAIDKTTIYGVQSVDDNGFKSEITTVQAIIHPLPSFGIVPNYGVCTGSPSFDLMTLVTDGNGGTWSGENVSGNKFLTVSASPGKYILTYTERNEKGCDRSENTTFEVYSLPVPQWTDGTISADIKNTTFDLRSFVSPSGGKFSGNNVTETGIFNASTAGAGTHEVTYTVQNANGCTNTARKTIEVLTTEVQCRDTERCGMGAITLTASGGVSYLWYLYNGSTYVPIENQTGAVLSQTIDRTTIYGVQAVNAQGFKSDIQQVTATVNPLPAFTVRSGGVCSGSPAYDLMQLVTDSNNGVWTGPFVQSNQFLTASAETGKSYSLTYTEHSEKGCDRSESIIFAVFALPIPKWTDEAIYADIKSKSLDLTDFVSSSGGKFSGNNVTETGIFNASAAGAGTHEITYTVHNSNGCYASAKKSVQVLSALVECADVERCGPGLVTLSASGGVSYLWYAYNGGYIPISEESSSVLRQNITATSVYGVQSVDVRGFKSDILRVTAIVHPLPDFTLQSGGACLGTGTFDLMGLVTNGNGGTWSGENVSNNKFLTASASPGKYTLTYTEQNTNGCEQTESITFEVYALPTPEWTSGPIYADIQNTSFDLSRFASPAGGVFSGNHVSGKGIFNAAVAGAGTHEINYTVTNGNGCSTTVKKSVQVLSTSVQCGDTERCGAGQITLTASGGTSYLWYTDNGGFVPISGQTGATLTQTIDKTTVYGVQAVNEQGFKSDIRRVTATVHPLPDFTLKTGGVAANVPDFDLMTLVSGGNGGTWSGQYVSGNKFLTASASPGKYTLNYTERNANGCEKVENTIFEVFALPVLTWHDFPDLCDASPDINLSDYVTPSGGVWSGSSVLPSGIFSPSKAGEGTHPVAYTYTDKNGVTVSEERTVRVDSKTTLALPFEDVFTYDGAPVTLTVPDFIPGVLYNWYDNGGEKIHEGTEYSVTAGKTPLVYTVRASHGCTDYTGTVKVSSDLFPDFEPSTASKTIAVNTPVQFMANAYREDYRYKWTFPETALSLSDPFYAFHNPGDYSIKLNIENARGGKVDKELPVTITAKNPEPPQNDFEITADTSQIVIKSKKEDTVSVRVIDNTGKTLYRTTTKINVGETRIVLPVPQIRAAETGLYIYANFKNADYQTFTQVQP